VNIRLVRGLVRRRRWTLAAIAATAIVLFVALWAGTPLGGAAGCANPVACENQLAGDPPSNWQVQGVGDPTIQGFATSFSVDVGQTVSFKIDTPSTNYHIDILRLGYYGGDGARLIASGIKPSVTLPQTQPACLTDSSNGLIDCGNWGVSASWTVPSTAVSGVYIAHLVRDDSQNPGGDSQIPFVVRNDASHSGIVVATSDATWEAYNDYGGNSLYTCTVKCPALAPLGYGAAYAVSYNRPFDGAFTTDGGASYLYYAEYQMIRFLEENGYDVSYVSDSDLDQSPALLPSHKVFISSGHDEYWSKNEYTNVKAALAAGVNLAFFSGNEIFWKTRWANSEDGSNTPYRTLITYKETHWTSLPVDPADPPTWTGAWADPRYSPPADGGVPANSLSGQEFLVNAGSADITVPSTYGKLRIWRNTAVASLPAGQSLTLAKGNDALGYEWDVDTDNGFRPAGEFDLSSTTVSGVQPFLDYGSTTGTGTATHNLTLYRAPSGALVFGAGTVQWSWGLDDTNAWASSGAGPPAGSTPDPNMQQATVNLFADMGVQPTTLMAGLVPASASTDTTPPTSTIASPSQGATIPDGTQVTITGSASDAGGGVVAGVEISTDGGSTWHPAAISGPDAQSVGWSYAWVAHGYPAATIETRAVDDSGNLEKPSDATTVSITCPCSIWGATPTAPTDSGDGQSIEVGVKFTTDTFGTVNGIRFYKVAANTGTHIGDLWTASGQLLASATFTGETSSGWQQVNFATPVPINPNTTYVASYFAPVGHYAQTTDYFYPRPSPTPWGYSIVDSPPLHALRNSGSTINGVYSYSKTSAFPTSTYEAQNYWVDVSFTPAPAPGTVTGVTATGGNGAAVVSWKAPSSGGPVTSYTVTPYSGGVAQPATTVTGTPAPTSTVVSGLQNGVSYSFTVAAANPNGAGPASSPSNQVTPAPQAIGFVQQVTARVSASSLSLTPAANVTVGNRLVVLVGVWNGSGATASSVTDSAGDTYTELLHFLGSDGTEMSVWSAPITSGGGTRPTVTVNATASADIGAAVSEYAGLALVSGAAILDQSAHAAGTTSGAGSVASGATPATTAGNELALGMYVDSGFDDTLSAGSGYTQRSNISNAGDMELLSEDQLLSTAGATPNATVGTGAGTTWLMATVVLKGGSSGAPTAPGAPTAVTATAGNASATVSWTAPPNGGSTILSYTITPYIGTTAQPTTTITGSPPATSTTVTGLTNGQTYTFTITATNAINAGPASTASNAVTPTATVVPAFVQQISAHKAGVTSLAVTPASNITSGNRLVVLVGVWSAGDATAKSVVDAAGNTYTEITHFAAADGTEMSVWTAPITKGGGTKPAITVTPSAKADVGVAALEYSGLSAAAGTGAIDQTADSSGSTSSAATVSSGATPATTAAGELALGFYADSGFGDTLTAGSGFTSRTNVSKTSDIEFVVEDEPAALGATPNASAGTGADTTWLMSTIVFKHS